MSAEEFASKVSRTKPDEEDEDLVLKVEVGAPPALVYKLFTDVEMMQRFSHARAVAEPKVGGRYSLYDGNIVGVYDELVEVGGGEEGVR